MNIKCEISQFLDSDGRLTALPSKYKKKLDCLVVLGGKGATERRLHGTANKRIVEPMDDFWRSRNVAS